MQRSRRPFRRRVDSELEINAPDEEDVILDDVQRDGELEEEAEEQAKESEEDQGENGGEGDKIDIDNTTMFTPYVPYLGLISDKLFSWNTF